MSKLDDKTKSLSSLQGVSLQEIIKGMYAGKPLLGSEVLLTQIAKDLIQPSLQAEMESHLQKNALESASNRRNGLTSKALKQLQGHLSWRHLGIAMDLLNLKSSRNSRQFLTKNLIKKS